MAEIGWISILQGTSDGLIVGYVLARLIVWTTEKTATILKRSTEKWQKNK